MRIELAPRIGERDLVFVFVALHAGRGRLDVEPCPFAGDAYAHRAARARRTGEVALAVGEWMNITVAMNAGQYAGAPVDWWFVVCSLSAQPVWYCMNTAGQLEVFDGNNLATCRPALQGPLFELPPYSVVNMPMPPGNYQVWFAVDYPMDGFLDVQGQFLMDTVTIYGAQ